MSEDICPLFLPVFMFFLFFIIIEVEVCGTYNQVTCYNNGTCYNNSCVCPYPYTGYDCSFTVGKRFKCRFR